MKHEPKNQKKGPIIRLWDHAGTALIVVWPSGVRYSNQTMGTACLHPEQEGVLIPFGNDGNPIERLYPMEKKLYDYFTGPPYRGSGAMRGISEADADKLDRFFQGDLTFSILSVDRTRLHDSHEAWLYVLVQKRESPAPLFSGLGTFPLRAVLTWNNSD
jgi:hypothetical protein